MSGFTKLWSEIINSSIWNENDKTRIVWITMLATMGPDYIVRASIGGLAHSARVSRKDCIDAIKILSGPDPDSRSTTDEGRRIREIPGGFFIINGDKYRKKRGDEERRVYMTNYMREYRKKQGENGLPCKPDVNTCKTHVNSCKPQLAQAEAEAEAEAEQNCCPQLNSKSPRDDSILATSESGPRSSPSETNKHGEKIAGELNSAVPATNQNGNRSYPTESEVKAHAALVGIPETTASAFFDHFESMGWLDKNANPVMKWQPKLQTWWRSEQDKREKERLENERREKNGRHLTRTERISADRNRFVASRSPEQEASDEAAFRARQDAYRAAHPVDWS